MKSCMVKPETGFALIESMISVLLLSIGAIGIALSTATTVKINTDNQARAVALSSASNALEPLYIAASVTEADAGTTLRAKLESYLVSVVPGMESAGYIVSSNPDENGVNRDTFVVKVLKAVDAVGANVLTTAAPYVSPVTIVVQVDYTGIGGKNVTGVEEVKSVKTSYTFVLKS